MNENERQRKLAGGSANRAAASSVKGIEEVRKEISLLCTRTASLEEVRDTQAAIVEDRDKRLQELEDRVAKLESKKAK